MMNMKVDLYNANCLDILKELPDKSIDLILTDPPYGTTNCIWDIPISLEDMWQELDRICKNNAAIILFGDEPFSSQLRLSSKNYKYDLIWQKEAPTNFFQLKRRPGKITENIHVFYKEQCTYNPIMIKHEGKLVKNKPAKKSHSSVTTGIGSGNIKPYEDTGFRYPSNILKFNRVPRRKNKHPTQKPVELLEWLIKTYSNSKDVVLDFTMGSGSTGVAAKRLNRSFIGIELNKEFFDIAKNRIDNDTF